MANRFAVPVTQLVNDSASGIASGWKINFYVTGTSTRKDTFSDNGLTVANANPVVADQSGRFGDIFMEDGTYKVVLTDGAGLEKWTADPVTGSLGTSGAVIAKTASYTVVSGDSTKLVNVDATSGALTVTLLPAASATDGFEVSVKKTDSSVNTVTIDGNGAETIDGAATLVLSNQYDEVTLRCDGSNWFVVAADHGGLGRTTNWKKGNDIASASPLVLGTDGNYSDVTGTTGFSQITVRAGILFMLQFDGVLTMTDGANLDLGGANITTAAGDRGLFFAVAANTAQLVAWLQEGNAVGGTDVQSFTASGTWTKPSFGTYALVEVWGGGSSGAVAQAASAGGGGGGGGYKAAYFLLSALGATETVTIGAGGASVTVANTAGNGGGSTTFGSLLTGYGGGGGIGSAGVLGGGGGGGGGLQVGNGGSGTNGGAGGAPAGGAANTDADGYGGGGGANGTATPAVAGKAAFGGGGGGGGGSTGTLGGGDSIFGGGGGGGARTTSGAGVGGTSEVGGDGGAGALDAANATAGTQPGGGGGGAETGNSGAGADGQCRVTVV